MKPILLATDGSPTAEEATEKAIELANLLGAPLVVVTAWDIPYSTLGYAAVPVVPDLGKLAKEQADKVAAAAATRARSAGVEVQALTLRGFPVEEICRAAEKHEPQLLVIGSHGWSPIKRLIFGSVSTGVLHHAKCPVLIVPAGAPDEAPEQKHEQAKAEV
ncbi:MAG: universal stress protein [Actinobacteria bacterium]|nr:MAG: universal stress protein [Actinomycetota bacterium]